MDKEITFLEVLISWFPMLVFAGVFLFFMRRMGSKSGMNQMDYLEGILEEEKRHNAQLEQIIKQTNQRLDRLEGGARHSDTSAADKSA